VIDYIARQNGDQHCDWEQQVRRSGIYPRLRMTTEMQVSRWSLVTLCGYAFFPLAQENTFVGQEYQSSTCCKDGSRQDPQLGGIEQLR
jgi:hypothetical protein